MRVVPPADMAIKLNWFLLLPYYLMAATNGLKTALYDVDM